MTDTRTRDNGSEEEWDNNSNNSDDRNSENNNYYHRRRQQQQPKPQRNNNSNNHRNMKYDSPSHNKKKNRFNNNNNNNNNNDDFKQRYQQEQQQQDRFNPFELFSRFLLENDNSTTTTKRRKLLSLFPTHKPRHVIDGVTTLVRSILVGIGLGIVSFISIPVAEYMRLHNHQQEDDDIVLDQQTQSSHNHWINVFVGGINGALFGSTFILVGFVNGFYQAVRGLMYTPIAIQAIRRGMIWDRSREIWKLYYLSEELNELDSFQPFQDETRSIKDLTYYNMLNVQTHASEKEIKRAYYNRARMIHPDKNPGNQSAADEFRKIHAAYLTLTDTERRIAYDRWGRTTEKVESGGADDAPGVADFDPNTFFSILLHSKPVEQYIGNSTFASFMKQSMHLVQSGNGKSAEDVIRLVWDDNKSISNSRQRRHLTIAVYLNEKVSAYLNGTISATEFRMQCQREAITIARTPFGLKYLISIGTVLNLESNRYTIINTKLFGKVRSGLMSTRYRLSAIKSSGHILRNLIDAVKRVRENSMTIEDEADVLKFMLPALFELGWMVYVIDFHAAIRGACFKLFSDASVKTHRQRLERAKAIRILSEEFLLVAQQEMEHNGEILLSSDDLSARIQVATQISVMKASGFDVPDDTEGRIQEAKSEQTSK